MAWGGPRPGDSRAPLFFWTKLEGSDSRLAPICFAGARAHSVCFFALANGTWLGECPDGISAGDSCEQRDGDGPGHAARRRLGENRPKVRRARARLFERKPC